MADDTPAVLISRSGEGGVFATITLNRPAKRNALGAEMVEGLCAALGELAADPAVRVVILRGGREAFCAGADLEALKAMQTATLLDNLADSRRLCALFLALYRHPVPVIAMVEGPALAGGAGLASCCDFVLAADGATFGYPEVKIGFVAAIVMVFLARQVGERRARELVLTGRVLQARDAADFGLVNEVVPPQRLEARTMELAASLAANSGQAMTLSKQLLGRIWDDSLEVDLEHACQMNADARSTADCHEGIASFLEKRRPVWGDRRVRKGD